MTNNINLPISDSDVWLVRLITANTIAIPNLNDIKSFFGSIGDLFFLVIRFSILILLSPLLMILIILSINKIKSLAVKFKETESLLTRKALLNMTFNDVKKMENTLNLFNKLFSNINKDADNDILARTINVDVLTIKNSINNIVSNIKSTYKVNAKDFFDNDSDYEEYVKEISVFNDIWDYQSTEAEQKTAFNHNKNIAKDAIC